MDEFNFDRSVGNYFESEFVESPKFYFAGNFSIGKNRILGPFFCACHSQHSSLGGAQALDVVTSAAVVRIAATFDRQDGEPLLRDSAVPTRGQGTGVTFLQLTSKPHDPVVVCMLHSLNLTTTSS